MHVHEASGYEQATNEQSEVTFDFTLAQLNEMVIIFELPVMIRPVWYIN